MIDDTRIRFDFGNWLRAARDLKEVETLLTRLPSTLRLRDPHLNTTTGTWFITVEHPKKGSEGGVGREDYRHPDKLLKTIRTRFPYLEITVVAEKDRHRQKVSA